MRKDHASYGEQLEKYPFMDNSLAADSTLRYIPDRLDLSLVLRP